LKIAWGVTGGGDKIIETVSEMKTLKDSYGESLTIEVFFSKAGFLVSKIYHLLEEISSSFDKYWLEEDANTPFLSGRLQSGHFDLFIIAPATSNTVAKLSVGIADTLLTNSALQAVKGFVPVYIMPTDFKAGETMTILPNGKKMKLRVRWEDAENVRRLEKMDGFYVLETPEQLIELIKKRL
jgi:archaeoflavoprotein AfpA